MNNESIPAEELERIKQDAENFCQDIYLSLIKGEQYPNGYKFSHLQEAYMVAASREYLRHASKPAIGLPWVKAEDRYPKLDAGQVYIRYDDNYCQRELGDRNYIIQLLENGWLNVEWLDESIPYAEPAATEFPEKGEMPASIQQKVEDFIYLSPVPPRCHEWGLERVYHAGIREGSEFMYNHTADLWSKPASVLQAWCKRETGRSV